MRGIPGGESHKHCADVGAETLFEEIQMDIKVIAKHGFVIIDFKIRNNF